MSKRIAMVDGDVVVYRSGFAAQANVHYVHWFQDGKLGEMSTAFIPTRKHKPTLEEVRTWCSENARNLAEKDGNPQDSIILTAVHPEPVEYCLHTVNAIMKSIVENTEADEVEVYLSPGWTFRHEMATLKTYKGNRVAPKPVHKQAITDYLVEHWGAKSVKGIEADDAIGIYARGANRRGDTAIVCTIDKDMNQIVGEHYNIVTQEPYNVSADEAWKLIFLQTLTGDATDNIPGLFRYGPVKAKKALAGCTTRSQMRAAVIREYEKAGQAKNLLENARLVYILRSMSEIQTPPKWMQPYIALTDVA